MKPIVNFKSLLLRRWSPEWAILVLGASVFNASAAEGSGAGPEPSIYDRVWRYADWYRNDRNPIIQAFQFTGRFQLDYSVLDSNQGSHDEWNIRRFRLGGKSRLFEDFTVHVEGDFDPQEPDPFYQRLTDAYLAWSRGKEWVVTMGKHSAPFTLEGATSSKELLTIDRGNLANNLWFPNEYFPGVSLSGQARQWRYWTGVYSAGEDNREFGKFNGGAFVLGTVGYDFAKVLGVKQALLAVHGVFSERDSQSTWTRSVQNVGSLNFSLDAGRWGVRSDLAAGDGHLGQSDLWGAMLMPFFNLTGNLQLVGRYTFLQSNDRNGVRLALYENTIVPGRGDEYQEIYLGLNYYFYKHKLKLQTAVQYADMTDRARDGGDYSGWAWTTGLRIAW